MRLFLQYHSASTAVAPSALFSVVTHAALFGAAVYGSGPRPDRPSDESTRVYYLPPPDRVPRREALVEHLQFIDVGAGRASDAPLAPTGRVAGRPMVEERKNGSALRMETAVRNSENPVPSADSVYSILSVDETAARVEGSAAPIYPKELIAAGVEGSVLTRYVIDTTGRADSASLQVLSASHAAFVTSVRQALPGMRFLPASIQGHAVRQMVEQNFEFHIIPPVRAPAEHTRTKPVP